MVDTEDIRKGCCTRRGQCRKNCCRKPEEKEDAAQKKNDEIRRSG